MPSTNEIPRWYKTLVEMNVFHWDIYKNPKKPEGPCYEVKIELIGLDHTGYCSGYSDDVDTYLDGKSSHNVYDDDFYLMNKLERANYTSWLPLTDTDGKPWDFEVVRFKNPDQNGCCSESGSGACRIDPVIILKSATKIE